MPPSGTPPQWAEWLRWAIENSQRPSPVSTVLLILQIVTVFALILTVWKTWQMASAASASADAAEASVGEMRATRTQEMRPYVIVYLDPFSSPRNIKLVIENVGRTPAWGLSFDCDQPLGAGIPGWDLRERSSLFSSGRDFLAPGQKMELFFGPLVAASEESVVRKWQITLTYVHQCGEEPHRETQTLDLDAFAGIMVG